MKNQLRSLVVFAAVPCFVIAAACFSLLSYGLTERPTGTFGDPTEVPCDCISQVVSACNQADEECSGNGCARIGDNCDEVTLYHIRYACIEAPEGTQAEGDECGLPNEVECYADYHCECAANPEQITQKICIGGGDQIADTAVPTTVRACQWDQN